MAKLVFPGVGAPYRGFIGELRGWFQRIASYVERSPGAAAAINSQIGVLAGKTGYVTPIPSTSKRIDSGAKVAGPAVTGTYTNGYTFTIVNGNITAIVAS